MERGSGKSVPALVTFPSEASAAKHMVWDKTQPRNTNTASPLVSASQKIQEGVLGRGEMACGMKVAQQAQSGAAGSRIRRALHGSISWRSAGSSELSQLCQLPREPEHEEMGMLGWEIGGVSNPKCSFVPFGHRAVAAAQPLVSLPITKRWEHVFHGSLAWSVQGDDSAPPEPLGWCCRSWVGDRAGAVLSSLSLARHSRAARA